MRTRFLLLGLAACTMASAQQKLPVIRANNAKATIIEGAMRSDWYISPEAKPDVHRLTKHTKPQRMVFKTDIDSIVVSIKPGKQFDFIVLLNGKDSAYTRFQSMPLVNYSKKKPVQHDTLHFELTSFNNVKVKAVVNKTDTLDLKFDSGTTGLLLTNNVIKNKTRITTPMKPMHHLQLGNMQWDNLMIYPVELSGQGTDGRFGWDLFDGKIVEIDYDKSLFVVHSRRPTISKDYAAFDIEYINTLFCIQASLQVKGANYPARFLFDNGYQRTIMLDTTITHAQHYPEDLPVIKKTILRNGQGKEIPVITVNNEKLVMGPFELKDVPAQLLATTNPARFDTHILGGEVLKRFNMFLDFQKNIVYLKPNTLYHQPYAESM
ncbi:hypothetical protein LX64_00839 [Chitinophaga skermanii]|uniref:Aspartyl protease n=1 Tax=Chitinophaga skermanii TaxID=331697 RepID=A0A327QX44_9BACT|nr:hypothetical protein [Chitinophaga skermanii]RAJ08192.1 hypothetical protein LX64_00839 [Chitinophaga skermanii]